MIEQHYGRFVASRVDDQTRDASFHKGFRVKRPWILTGLRLSSATTWLREVYGLRRALEA